MLVGWAEPRSHCIYVRYIQCPSLIRNESDTVTESSESSSSQPSALVTPVVAHGDLLFVSGQLPRRDGKLAFVGKLGSTVSLDEGREAARLCALACVAVINGSLPPGKRLARIVKITGFVASADGFADQGRVIDAASTVFIDTYGAIGAHARSAIGVAELPHGASVEVEVIAGLESAHAD
jgi:enamine deaminase RidA (YjgF/YER057c/UK114 family)